MTLGSSSKYGFKHYLSSCYYIAKKKKVMFKHFNIFPKVHAHCMNCKKKKKSKVILELISYFKSSKDSQICVN